MSFEEPWDEDQADTAMSPGERNVWVYLVIVVLTSGTYFIAMGVQLLSTPAESIRWVAPLLWALGTSIGANVLATVIFAVVFERGEARAVPLVDERDRVIGQYAGLRHSVVLGSGIFVVLVLSMFDADTFWTGNAAFAFGTLGAIVETTFKIRAYRGGF